jgi:hypothetical protein
MTFVRNLAQRAFARNVEFYCIVQVVSWSFAARPAGQTTTLTLSMKSPSLRCDLTTTMIKLLTDQPAKEALSLHLRKSGHGFDIAWHNMHVSWLAKFNTSHITLTVIQVHIATTKVFSPIGLPKTRGQVYKHFAWNCRDRWLVRSTVIGYVENMHLGSVVSKAFSLNGG